MHPTVAGENENAIFKDISIIHEKPELFSVKFLGTFWHFYGKSYEKYLCDPCTLLSIQKEQIRSIIYLHVFLF